MCDRYDIERTYCKMLQTFIVGLLGFLSFHVVNNNRVYCTCKDLYWRFAFYFEPIEMETTLYLWKEIACVYFNQKWIFTMVKCGRVIFNDRYMVAIRYNMKNLHVKQMNIREISWLVAFVTNIIINLLPSWVTKSIWLPFYVQQNRLRIVNPVIVIRLARV